MAIGRKNAKIYGLFAITMSTLETKKFAEFFAGIGLMRMGLERAGWEIAFANDIDDDKWQMYSTHFGNTGEFIVGDIHQLKPTQIPNVTLKQLATASFLSWV